MKKKLSIIIGLLLFIPMINVRADGISCAGSSEKDALVLKDISNFSCSGITGTNVTFTNNENDLKEYFEQRTDDINRINVKDNSLSISSEKEYIILVIKDKDTNNSARVYIKNPSYVATTTTQPTSQPTTTSSTKTLTVTLDPNNGTEKSTKTCELTGNNTNCSITLPKLENENFNGWGTSKTCKEGNIGSQKIEKDITYYACYKNTDTTITTTASNTNNSIYLKTLVLKDKDTNDTLDIGTFSMKKNEYTLKVLNKVENILVTTTQDENITAEITGNENLNVGENEIIIKLTDEDNNTNEYKIIVTRLKEGETITNIHFLKSLVVGGYNINFNKEQFIYSLTIPSDINRLEITAIPEEETSVVEIKGNEELVDGSLITVNIIGEDNETTTYTINITKEASVNYMLIVAVGIIILLIVILVILIIIKSNKKKKNIKNDSKPKVLKEEKKETIETLNI